MAFINKARKVFSRIPFWQFVFGSIASYAILRIGISYLTGKNIWDTLENAISNTLDNMIAGLGFAVVVWATKDSVRQFLEADRNFMTRPICSIHDLADSLEKAVDRHRDAFRSEVDSVKNAYICIISPMHISAELVDHMCAHDDPLKETTKNKISNFNSYIHKVTNSPNGAYDILVFGRTGIENIDKATCTESIVKYALSGKFPGTSEFGLHFNRDEEGVIIFGECNLSQPSNPRQVTEVIGFSFDDEYKAIDGNSCVDPHIASRRLAFQLRKVRKIRGTSKHWVNETNEEISISGNAKFRNIKEAVEDFFLTGIPKRE